MVSSGAHAIDGTGSGQFMTMRANGHDSVSGKAMDGAAFASVGAWLSARRSALGESLETVEAATRVRQDYLSAIEDMDPRRMPTGPYAPGFVRTYALHLGLDPNEVADRFSQEITPRRARGPRVEAGGGARLSISPRAWTGLAVAAVFVAMIAYGLRPGTSDAFNVVPPVPEALEEWAGADVSTRVGSSANELVGGPELALRARVPAFVEAESDAGHTFISRTLERDEVWVVPRVRGVSISVDNGAAIEVLRGGRSEGRLGGPGLPVTEWSADVAREFGAAQVGVVAAVEPEPEPPQPQPINAAERAEAEAVADAIVSEIEQEAELVTPELPAGSEIISEVLPSIIIGDLEPVVDPAEAAAAEGPARIGGNMAAPGSEITPSELPQLQ